MPDSGSRTSPPRWSCRPTAGSDSSRQRASKAPAPPVLPPRERAQVAGPLKRTDCSLVSDGAAALIVVQGFLPMSQCDSVRLEECAKAWNEALLQAGLWLSDLSLVETHDCFTIADPIEYEAMDLVPVGRDARSGRPGCRCMCCRRCNCATRPATYRSWTAVRRHLQQGQCCGSKLCQHPRPDPLSDQTHRSRRSRPRVPGGTRRRQVATSVRGARLDDREGYDLAPPNRGKIIFGILLQNACLDSCKHR